MHLFNGHARRVEQLINKKYFCYGISDFTDMTVISYGQYSVLYRAFCKRINSLCILKLYNTNCLKELVNELEIYQKINFHPNITQLYGITKNTSGSGPAYALVLEYADSTLASYLDVHFDKLTWDDKYELAFQLASAISHLHDEDIAHCNLHSKNVLVHQNNIKVVSFSTSRVIDKKSSDKSGIFGSLDPKTDKSRILCPFYYVDPKLLSNEIYKLNKKSDVYNTGVLLWQISSGCEPFNNRSRLNLSKEIQNGLREVIIDGTPEEYSNLYTECWQDNPDKRPDIQQVVSILNQLKLSKTSSKELFDNFKENNQTNDGANEWIENALKHKTVNYIPFNELKVPELSGPFNRGGFGSIIKVIWIKTNNYVVYKKLTNPTAVKHDILDAFIHELQIHLRLNHSDRIIHCLGISQDKITKEYLLVMQYADGGDLQNYLKNNFKRLSWIDKKKLAWQISEGLNYLHNENVLHRDLHSKNIVIHENNAKITDFGISKFQSDLNSTYVGVFGSIAYMEPKRILDPKFPYTKSSDIYSFGVLMWEISSGHPPFKDSFSNSDKFALALAINNGVREGSIPNTPKEYEELYKNCWNQKPEKRPTISEILEEFSKMGFGINAKNEPMEVKPMEIDFAENTNNNSNTYSELQFNSSSSLLFNVPSELINNSVEDKE